MFSLDCAGKCNPFWCGVDGAIILPHHFISVFLISLLSKPVPDRTHNKNVHQSVLRYLNFYLPQLIQSLNYWLEKPKLKPDQQSCSMDPRPQKRVKKKKGNVFQVDSVHLMISMILSSSIVSKSLGRCYHSDILHYTAQQLEQELYRICL